ncbi:MAG TPA: hypothetical protein VMV81_00580, partial [Phycisphaerae bacterium]|nr:hypothetical protein [Phycisphaerae bacterium]
LRPDLAFASERRLRAVLQGSTAGLSAAAHQFLLRSQAGRLLVTLEKRGVVTFERPTEDQHSPAWNGRLRSEYLPSMAHRVIDRLGVSSSMLVMTAMARAAGASLMQAAYLGEAIAAVGLASPGLTAVTSDELRSFLAARPELVRAAPPQPATAQHGSNSTGGRLAAAIL